jgi:hypothetical protein
LRFGRLVHDYFHILGVSRNARASEIRRACGRHVRRPHPDFCEGDRLGAAAPALSNPSTTLPADASVDFVELTNLVDRMVADFFKPTFKVTTTHEG